MNIETPIKKSDIFRLSFEQKIKPYIDEKFTDGVTKVILSEDYINETLKFYYSTDNLYIKMRNMLIGTDLGVSIKRKNKEFVFYKVSNDVNRESDLFKVTFENKLNPYLLEIFKDKCVIGFEENFLKELLEIDYGAINMYNNLKNILSNTNIIVSTNKNKIIDGKKINEFVFCDVNKKKYLEEENNRIIENEIKRKKEITENIRKENKELIDNINIALDNSIKISDVNEIYVNESCDENVVFNCPNLECKNKVKYRAERCEICNEPLEWK